MDNGIVDRIRVIDHDLVILKAISAGSTLEAIADYKVCTIDSSVVQPNNDGTVCQDFVEDNSLCGRPACDSSGFIGEVERTGRVLCPVCVRISIFYLPSPPRISTIGGYGR